MRMPNFSAEDSLYKASKSYHAARGPTASFGGQKIVAQRLVGSGCLDACMGLGIDYMSCSVICGRPRWLPS
jgi:hypothetical protein